MATVDKPTPAQSEHEAPKYGGPLGAVYHWLDDRLGIDAVIRPIVVHPVPKNTNWFYVLGSATLIAFTFQVITGVFLALVYVPSPNAAFASLHWITYQSVLGRIVRGIHYWGASAMILLIFAHTARVFLTGSYKYPRELNWLMGVGLLFLTLGMGFTGQLLVWNQDSYWAIVVGAEQAARFPFIGSWLAQIVVAGQVVGASTLTHFYAIHVFLIPGLMFLLIGGHLYLVVYQGISEWPEPGDVVDPATYKQRYHEILQNESVPFFPDAMAKDAFFALIVGIVVIVLAVTAGPAPLGVKADPTNFITNPRPFWFLIWYFALLAMIPAEVENYFMIGFPLIIIVFMLALPFWANRGERAASRRPWAVGSVGAAVLISAVLMYEGYASPWAPVFSTTGKLLAVPPAVVSNLKGPARTGAHLFKTEGCIACHMVHGVGGVRGPDVDNIIYQFPVRARLIEQILYGGHGTSYQYMPAFGKILNPSQVNDLVAFLNALPKANMAASSSHQAAPSGNAAPAARQHTTAFKKAHGASRPVHGKHARK